MHDLDVQSSRVDSLRNGQSHALDGTAREQHDRTAIPLPIRLLPLPLLAVGICLALAARNPLYGAAS